MISIVPAIMKNRRTDENLIITDIRAKNADRFISLCEEGGSPMSTPHVEVKHRNASSIEIGFVSPEFTSRNPLYSYELTRKHSKRRLSGTTDENHLTFTGLRPGKYIFNIWIAGKKDVPESHHTLQIDIKAHPMLGTTASILYIIIGIGNARETGQDSRSR